MADSISPNNPPYLTLTISQALSLPPPPSPEPRQHDSVNSMLDSRAIHMPDKLAVGFTYLTSDSKWKCHTLTYAQIRTLSLYVASALQERLPERTTNAKSPNRTPLVAVLSPSGVDLFAHIVALWRLGYGVLCIAPGSPSESTANLLRLTETTIILAHPSQIKAARAAVEAVSAEAYEMLSSPLELMHSEAEPQEMVESAGAEDVLVTMHTSGSSGLPKPIYQLHRFWTASMLSAPGRNLSAFTTTPLFHGGMSDLLRSIQAGSSIFFHPTADPGALSTTAIASAIKTCPEPISYFLSVPYILDMLFNDKSDEGRSMLARMELVSTGGAPLPQRLGDAMVKEGIRLVSRLGSSECGFLMSSWRDFEKDKEWNQLRIPDELGHQMIRFERHDPNSPQSELYELVVNREWPTKLVANRDDGSYASSDLYAKHPTLPNTWRYDSRSDDTIVLVSGKKATAPLAEQKLKASPLVSEAIVFGANRAILGALVFVAPEAVKDGQPFDDKAKIELLKQLQPTLKQINSSSPPHAQLATEMIYLLPPSEVDSIPRASKGTLQRGRAYQHYSDLIDSIYTDFEEGRSLRLTSTDGGKEDLSGSDLIEWLKGKVEAINGSKVNEDADLFVAGVDSIQSARIRAAIHQNVELGGRLLDRNAVYEYPTLRLLAEHIEEVRSGGEGRIGGDERQQRELKLMHELVEKYSAPQQSPFAPSRAEDGVRGTLYILSGVTGGLGAQVLHQVLSQSSHEDVVVCLVRAPSKDSAKQRVLDSLQSRHLTRSSSLVQSAGNVKCLPSDLSKPNLGLEPSYLPPLSPQARVVTIHSAWSVNFVASLSSFETENIAGLSHLLDLHHSLATSGSCFMFCSSVASILSSSDAQSGAQLNERLSTKPADAVAMGYARSKWVAEQLVAQRALKGRSAVVRIGQLCSDTKHGVWNESEAWPILIQLSQQIRCFPDLRSERLHWLSTDVAARTVLDLALHPPSSKSGGVEMYNVAQPTTTGSREVARWTDFYNWLKAAGLNLELVSPKEWLDKIRQEDSDHRGLLPLWEKNFTNAGEKTEPRFVCDKALHASKGLQAWQKEGVTQELIEKTVQRWKTIGFLK